MDSPVYLYDATNIDEYQWPDTADGRTGKGYLYPFIKEGVKPFLHNVSTKTLLVACNNVFLPLTVNEKEYENSYIASNYYGIKFYEENFAKKHPYLNRLQKPFLALGALFLKLFKINKTIFLNNWLMTNSLSPKIGAKELKSILAYLTKKFPAHTIIYRHLDAVQKKELLETLKESKFHLLRTRDIFFYNPEEKPFHKKEIRGTCRRDLKLIESYNYEIVRADQIQESDYARIIDLYEMLYVNKYSKYSPRYTKEFVKNTHQNKMVNYVLLKKGGVVEGFYSYLTFNNAMINCLFGYDVTLDHSHDVYKILTRLVIEEAEKLNLMINDGSGGDSAKINRGMKSTSEFMGIYNAHLPLPRRLLWDAVALCFPKF